MSLQYIKKEVRKGVHFQLADEHQSFLQVDFNTLGIKDAYKVILSLLLGVIKHSQSTQSNKFVTSLQYLKKRSQGNHFLYADEHFTSFYKLGLFFDESEIFLPAANLHGHEWQVVVKMYTTDRKFYKDSLGKLTYFVVENFYNHFLFLFFNLQLQVIIM